MQAGGWQIIHKQKTNRTPRTSYRVRQDGEKREALQSKDSRESHWVLEKWSLDTGGLVDLPAVLFHDLTSQGRRGRSREAGERQRTINLLYHHHDDGYVMTAEMRRLFKVGVSLGIG